MPQDALKQWGAIIASRALAVYLMAAAAVLWLVAALWFAAGLTAGDDQPGLLTFGMIAAAFAVPGAVLGISGLALWRAARQP